MPPIGIRYAFAAYALWGLLPVYWKSIREVPAFEILCHRMLWSFLFVVVILLWKNHWSWIGKAFTSKRTIVTFLCTSMIIATNWLIYIWAVNSGYIVESSLGYFINPLLNVLLGVVFLKEKLRPLQWSAVGLAAMSVAYLTLAYGAFPWIALTLALTFALYGLLRKTCSLNALEGLSMESAILFIPALAYLLFLEHTDRAAFGHAGMRISLLLASAGVITAGPLLMFAAGARRITLSTLGLMQYIAPTLMFVLGVFVYGEAFSRTRMIGFIFIWMALLMYSVDGIRVNRKHHHGMLNTTCLDE